MKKYYKGQEVWFVTAHTYMTGIVEHVNLVYGFHTIRTPVGLVNVQQENIVGVTNNLVSDVTVFYKREVGFIKHHTRKHTAVKTALLAIIPMSIPLILCARAIYLITKHLRETYEQSR